MSQVLFQLAERPDLVLSLREEIEMVIEEEGWTTAAFVRMWKLDSILRESQRYNGFTLGKPLPALFYRICQPAERAVH